MAKMSTCLGIRRRGPPKMTDPDIPLNPAAIRHRYGYAVNEVPEELFFNENKTRKF